MTPQIRKIVLRTEDQLVGYYKGRHLVVAREPDGRFYAIVSGRSGGHLMDGWLGLEVETMNAAVTEALMRAGLLGRTAA